MRKVKVYIDGFNLWHALCVFNEPHLRWLDLRSLVEQFIHQKEDVITDILYCSAYATHISQERVDRHKLYVSALESSGVTFIEGKFKKKYIKCPIAECNKREIKKHEEKETDVNLSIHFVRDAIKKEAEKYIIITNDTDILPAIKMIKKEIPSTYISVLTPPNYYPHADLWRSAKQTRPKRIQRIHIENALFPETIKCSNGFIIQMPSHYKKTNI